MSTPAGLLRSDIPGGRPGGPGFADGQHGGPPGPEKARQASLPDARRSADIGLWVFIGVATSLFWLFLLAFALRMNGNDWVTIALPRQLWLSTALLIAGSVLMQRASRAPERGAAAAGSPMSEPATRRSWIAAGALALAFVAVQLWAWQQMSARQVTVSGNPAASFFYLLTAMHALHVAGGLVAWMIVDRRLRSAQRDSGLAQRASAPRVSAQRDAAQADSASGDTAHDVWRIALCARYWHFLLAVWIALYAAIGWLSPEFVRYLCGTA